LPEDLVKRIAFSQFVYKLVEVPDLLHEFVFDFFHAIAADQASDFGSVGIELRSLGKEYFEVGVAGKDALKCAIVVAGEPLETVSSSCLVRPFFSTLAR